MRILWLGFAALNADGRGEVALPGEVTVQGRWGGDGPFGCAFRIAIAPHSGSAGVQVERGLMPQLCLATRRRFKERCHVGSGGERVGLVRD